MSGQLNIPIDAGATRRVAFTISMDGQPVDLSGSKVTFYSAWFSKPLSVSDDGSVVSLELTPFETRQMVRSPYAIDVEWPSGDVNRLLEGHLMVSRIPEVSTWPR